MGGFTSGSCLSCCLSRSCGSPWKWDWHMASMASSAITTSDTQARFILRSNDSNRGWLRRFLKRNEPLIPKIAPERRSKAFSSHSIAASASPRPVGTYAKWYRDTNSRSARSRSFCSISHARCSCRSPHRPARTATGRGWCLARVGVRDRQGVRQS